MSQHSPLSLEEIREANSKISGWAVRTPIVRLNTNISPGEIFLKMGNLQPIGSVKIRGAGNAMLSTSREQLQDGVWTASAGNIAQGVTLFARELRVKCKVLVPDTAPETKLQAVPFHNM